MPALNGGTIIFGFSGPVPGQSALLSRLGMIEHYAPAGEANEARLLIRPNLSLTLRQLSAVFAGLATVTAAIAGLAWSQGNVFAPWFALLHLSLLASGFVLVWRRGRRAEVIAVSPDRVSVHRFPEFVEVFSDHPYWVRLVESEGQVVLTGRRARVGVGSFLGEAERRQLAQDLRRLLDGGAPEGGSRKSN